jgi:TM2 domain-containing membrane protein YozV
VRRCIPRLKSWVLAPQFNIINGGGQLYNGDVAKGAIIFDVQIVNVMLMFVLIGFLTFPLVWLYSVYDAYKTAQSR